MEPQQIESSVINSTDEVLDFWAFVEVMGHSKIAGRLTTRKLGVSVMLQVDVLKPEGAGIAFSKLFSPSSIFSITPVSEDYCAKWSKESVAYDYTPVPYLAPTQPRLAVGSASESDPDYDDDDDREDYESLD